MKLERHKKRFLKIWNKRSVFFRNKKDYWLIIKQPYLDHLLYTRQQVMIFEEKLYIPNSHLMYLTWNQNLKVRLMDRWTCRRELDQTLQKSDKIHLIFSNHRQIGWEIDRFRRINVKLGNLISSVEIDITLSKFYLI